MANCKIKDKYASIECDRPALEGDPEGLCLLHSRKEDKDKDGVFTEAVTAKLAQEDYGFSGVFFPIEVSSFKNYRFENNDVDFSDATFSGDADFLGAFFSGVADFRRATFSGFSDFFWATFTSTAYFMDTIFSGEAHFSRVNFSGRISFFNAIFSAEAIFTYINQPNEENGHRAPFQADFRFLRLQTNAFLRFENVSLAQVQFGGTDLRSVRFFKVDWHRLHGRNAVYDEVLLKRHRDYDRVEELYRNLKFNYARGGDYKNAGDFHYGEMEMHRKASNKRRWVSWYSLYWLLSGYGERPTWAFIILSGLLVVLSGLFAWAEPNIGGSWLGARLWEAFLYIFQKGTFQRPEYQPISDSGKFLATLSPLLLPGQAALFFLALRNRLGRRR